MSTTSNKLSGKVAIVTGASKGIGAAIARHLGAAGASVVVNYSSSKEAADQVVAEITTGGGQAVAVQANVSQQADIEKLVAETVRIYGPIDVLVNNAGVYEFAPLGTITAEHFHRLYNTNVLGVILTTQEALKHFNPQGGSIINISSTVSTQSPAMSSVYGSTKAAIDGLTRSFSKELGARKIRVNAINPGPIETDGVRDQGLLERFHALGKQTALGRIGQPDDVAPAAVYLASDEAAWVTGEMHYVRGGLL